MFGVHTFPKFKTLEKLGRFYREHVRFWGKASVVSGNFSCSFRREKRFSSGAYTFLPGTFILFSSDLYTFLTSASSLSREREMLISSDKLLQLCRESSSSRATKFFITRQREAHLNRSKFFLFHRAGEIKRTYCD